MNLSNKTLKRIVSAILMTYDTTRTNLWKHAGYRAGYDTPQTDDFVVFINASSPPGGLAPITGNGTDESGKLNAIFDYIRATYLVPTSTTPINMSARIRIRFPSTLVLADTVYIPSYTELDFTQGTNPDTTVTLKPSAALRYETGEFTTGPNGGAEADYSAFTDTAYGTAGGTGGGPQGGWMFPGLSFFQFQTKAVHPSYINEYNKASVDARHKKLYHGTINKHWKAGKMVDQAVSFPGVAGGTTIRIDASHGSTFQADFPVGKWCALYVANGDSYYDSILTTVQGKRDVPHLRTWIFRVKAVNAGTRMITMDRPLPFDVPSFHTVEGSVGATGSAQYTKIVPLDVVVGSGIRGGTFNATVDGQPNLFAGSGTRTQTNTGGVHTVNGTALKWNYSNVAPEYSIHTVVFREAVSCYVIDADFPISLSHAIATEFAAHSYVVGNNFGESVNKGTGGNGYVRLSKSYLGYFAKNVLTNLRHLTLQWGARFNVIRENELIEVNFHGGDESYNLVEQNNIHTPFEHNSGDTGDTLGYFPLWWGAYEKADGWSTATGRHNVVFNNSLKKQRTSGAAYTPWAQYPSKELVYIFGWDRNTTQGSGWEHLSVNNVPILDWQHNEENDYSTGVNKGVNALTSYNGPSLYEFVKGTATPIIDNFTT